MVWKGNIKAATVIPTNMFSAFITIWVETGPLHSEQWQMWRITHLLWEEWEESINLFSDEYYSLVPLINNKDFCSSEKNNCIALQDVITCTYSVSYTNSKSIIHGLEGQVYYLLPFLPTAPYQTAPAAR